MEELELDKMDFNDLVLKYQDLQEMNFMLEMKDHWTHDDFELSNKYHQMLEKINKEFKKREKGEKNENIPT